MYFLKTKGTDKIPDFIQVRDNNFTLFLHFKVDRIVENLKSLSIKTDENKIIEIIEKLEYGVLIEIN